MFGRFISVSSFVVLEGDLSFASSFAEILGSSTSSGILRTGVG